MTSLVFGGTSIKLHAGQTLLAGRDRMATLTVPDPHVSRQHAKVEAFEDGSVLVSDIGSVNGILVSGERVPWALLHAGSEFTIGLTRMRIEA
jgi:pSer/pThr/pTyr-binding forkhead associated (FHA) protein